MSNPASILLIISGGIAAYKCPDLVRQFKRNGIDVTVILTKSAEQFVTPLTLQTVSENKVYTDLFSLDDEHEIGHIQLSRKADLVLVTPATANIIAEMAHGLCRDLATTCLLATDKPVVVAPAMNVKMWEHPATQTNLETLKQRGVTIMPPNEGAMACGEFGIGRLPEPEQIFTFVKDFLQASPKPLTGKKAIVTAGPTHEPIDPVRFIGNYSSGKQGYAIAQKLAEAGAEVTLISGPTALSTPPNVDRIDVQTADQMMAACNTQLPADIAICTAAVADWKAESATQKIKKAQGKTPAITLSENPDILKTLSQHKNRPALVVGFAAETERLELNAKEKRLRKGCNWIVANEISAKNPAFGADKNSCLFIAGDNTESWESQSKVDIAEKLVEKVALFFYDSKSSKEKDIA